MAESSSSSSFWSRHEFLIRRLHSLSGLLPVGAYMVVHLAVNASVLGNPASFQENVYSIHSFGPLLPVLEWVFIFLPILFHGVVGVAIMRGWMPNAASYPYASNFRYTAQRVTGIIALVFILWHVFHMHGWIHADWWLNFARQYGGGLFKPYNAASTAGQAMQASWLVIFLYGVGVLACVYHLANGLWTMGITWGAWTTPPAMKRAQRVCDGIGVLVAVFGVAALVGMSTVDIEEARNVEGKMYEQKVEMGVLDPEQAEHKRAQPAVAGDESESEGDEPVARAEP